MDNSPSATTHNEHPLDSLVGPFYVRQFLLDWLDVDDATLTEREETGRILAVPLKDGSWLYPTFQFDGGLELPGLPDVLAALRRNGLDEWASAIWLNEPAAQWQGASAARLLRTEHADEVVLQASEGMRRPLDERTKLEELRRFAAPAVQLFCKAVADLPVFVDPATLIVSMSTTPSTAYFLAVLPELNKEVIVLRFVIGDDPLGNAAELAIRFLRDRPWEASGLKGAPHPTGQDAA